MPQRMGGPRLARALGVLAVAVLVPALAVPASPGSAGVDVEAAASEARAEYQKSLRQRMDAVVRAEPSEDAPPGYGRAALPPSSALAAQLAEARYVEVAAPLAARSGLPSFVGRLGNWPHRGPITSPFAPRWGGFHNALDIGAPFFTPVYAAAAGIVTVVGRPYAASGDTAMVVGIAHGGDLTTVYVHLDDRRLPVVSVGQRVSAGQLIAYVGSTGWSTGPHTHFMTVYRGRAVDPLAYLPP